MQCAWGRGSGPGWALEQSHVEEHFPICLSAEATPRTVGLMALTSPYSGPASDCCMFECLGRKGGRG